MHPHHDDAHAEAQHERLAEYRRLHRHDCADGLCDGCERCAPGITDDDRDEEGEE